MTGENVFLKARAVQNWTFGPAQFNKGDILNIRDIRPCSGNETSCKECPGKVAIGAYIHACYGNGFGYALEILVDKFQERKERLLNA